MTDEEHTGSKPIFITLCLTQNLNRAINYATTATDGLLAPDKIFDKVVERQLKSHKIEILSEKDAGKISWAFNLILILLSTCVIFKQGHLYLAQFSLISLILFQWATVTTV